MRKKWIYLLLTACVLWSCAGREEQTLVLNSEADLSGLRVATQSGSCYDIELSPRTDIELQRYNTLSDAIQALPHGQTEAGLALGFTPVQTFFNIIFPQAVKRGLPLYKGLCINILKATSIVGYIAIQDLTRAGDLIRSRTFDALVPLLVVTVLYFLLVWLLAALFNLATKKKKVL